MLERRNILHLKTDGGITHIVYICSFIENFLHDILQISEFNCCHMKQLYSYLNPSPKRTSHKKLRKYQTTASRRKLFNLDIVVSHKRILESVRTDLTNVERTIFLLMAALMAVTAAIFVVIGDTELKTVNHPNLLSPLDQLSDTVVQDGQR